MIVVPLQVEYIPAAVWLVLCQGQVLVVDTIISEICNIGSGPLVQCQDGKYSSRGATLDDFPCRGISTDIVDKILDLCD